LIVLDEQISLSLIEVIRKWHNGKVISVRELRPNTIIKDEAIPQLLNNTKKQPTFVTINTKDFWKKTHPCKNIFTVCIKLEDTKMSALPVLLKSLTTGRRFKTKASRAGLVFWCCFSH
jgi:hypothetical protein